MVSIYPPRMVRFFKERGKQVSDFFIRMGKNLSLLSFTLFCPAVSAADGANGGITDGMAYILLPILLIIVTIVLFAIVLWLLIRNQYLEKLIRPLSLIPIQMGICNAQGQIFFYQNGKYDQASHAPHSLTELPIEIQQEFQKVLPEIFNKHDTQSIEFDVFKFRHKIDFFYLDENRWSSEPVAMWISHDITKLHQICLERERVAERFRRTLASIGDAVVVTNYDGEIIMLNPVAARLCRIAPPDAGGKKINECFQFLKVDLLRLVEMVIRNGQEYSLDSTVKCADSEEIIVEGKISPVKENEFLVAGTVLCFRDITERIRLNEQEQKALKLAQAADRAKSDFIAVMNHEFRSSLNIILGYCELIRMNTGSEASAELMKIQQESNKLLNDLNNLLDFSRSDFNKMEMVLAPTNFKDLLYEVQRIFLNTADNTKIPLLINVAPELPLFKSDYKIMRQILISTLAQAFTIVNTGEVTLSVDWEPPELKIEIGIPAIPDISWPAVKPYWEVNRKLLQLLNGFIEFHNEENQEVLSIVFRGIEHCGSVEAISIPAEHFKEKPQKNIVIIVDDIPVNLKILSLMLKRLEFESVSCSSVKEALGELERYTPTAILTDLWMPGCNGDELAVLLKSSPQTSGIPTVLVTADNQLDSRTSSLFNYTILKPVKLENLKSIMAKISHAA